MHAHRRGLTVLELLIIIIVLVVVVVLAIRMVRNRGAEPATAPLPDSALLAPPGSGNALTARLTFLAPLDTLANAGDTLDVRVRATTDGGTGVAQAAISLEVSAGGGAVLPDSAVTDDLGEVKARWVLGRDGAEQSLRATAHEPGVSPVAVTVHTGAPADSAARRQGAGAP